MARCDGRPQGSLRHGSIPPAGTLLAAAPSNPMCCSPATEPLLCPGRTAQLVALIAKSTRKLGSHLPHGGGTADQGPLGCGVEAGGKERKPPGPRGCTQAEGNLYQMLGSRQALQPKGTVLGLISPRAQISQHEEVKRRQPGAQPADTSLEILHIVFQCSRVSLRPGLTLHRGN